MRKWEKKQEQKGQEYRATLQGKEKTIEGLIEKNQNLLMQAKLLK